MPADLLFEIGCEEIPAKMLARALADLPAAVEQKLTAARLEWTAVRALGTPRRLAVIVKGLAERQPDLDEEVVGPPASAAFAADGSLTKAGQGFAAKNGVAADALTKKEVPGKKGLYVVARRHVLGHETRALLPDLLRDLAQGIPWPKSMRWGWSETTFVRPVQWLVAIYGGEVVGVEWAGMVGGRKSRGHRFLSPGWIEIASADKYVDTLRDAHVVELQPGERLDRDFILRWRVDAAELRSSLVCSDDADGKGGSFMLTLVPPSTLAVAQKPRDVVFVLDRSGSMQGWKMLAARRATARMIDTLTSRDRFHVITFDNAIEVLPDVRLTAATDRMRYRAVEELARIDARGGTELAQPLQLAVKALAGGHDDRERVIVLVTDGQVGNEDHILREIAPSLKNVRVFTLGIDQAVNAGFLRRLAGAGGGLCELVESEDRLDAVMAKVHHRIGTPVATELHLEAQQLDIDRASIAPAKLPDVYAGAPVVVLGRYRGSAHASAALAISGTTYGDPLQLSVVRDAEPATGSWLAASWARAHIRDLEDRYALGAREVEGEIVRVSKQFSVLSRFTAFLAVDRSQVVNQGGKLVQVVQPVESPAGWDMKAKTRMASFAAPGALPPPMAPSPSMVAAAPSPMRMRAPVAQAFGMPAGGPPPAPGAMAPMPQMPVQRREEPTDASAYLAKLAELARDLDMQARANHIGALRLLRQRLAEWVEDLRSVGGHDALADAVQRQAERLTAALASGDAGRGALEVATELARLASSGTPPRGKGRVDFWR